MRRLGFALLLLSACAPGKVNVRGEWKPRLDVAYSDGRFYSVWHRAAYPEARGASSGLVAYGGRVSGNVCNLDVWLEADYRGRRLQLSGFVEPIDRSIGGTRQPLPAHFEVRDVDGQRQIIGRVGDSIDLFTGTTGRKAATTRGDDWDIGENGSPLVPVDHRVDFAYDTRALHGRVARREFDLASDGDDNLVGTMSDNGVRFDFVLRGVSRLWSMPPVDQAAILPIMLSCDLGDRAVTLPSPDGHARLTLDLAQR